MKKIITIIVFTSMLLGLTACTKNEVTNTTETSSTTTSIGEVTTSVETTTAMESVTSEEITTAEETTTIAEETDAEQTVEDLLALAEARKQEVMTEELQAAMDGLDAFLLMQDNAFVTYDFLGVLVKPYNMLSDVEKAYSDTFWSNYEYISSVEINNAQYDKVSDMNKEEFYASVRKCFSTNFVSDDALTKCMFETMITSDPIELGEGYLFVEHNDNMYKKQSLGRFSYAGFYTYVYTEDTENTDYNCKSIYFDFKGESLIGSVEVQVIKENETWVVDKITAYLNNGEVVEELSI